MIADFDDLCLWGYVVVDELWGQLPAWYKPSRGPAPGCSDSELIAMALLGACRGWRQEPTLRYCLYVTVSRGSELTRVLSAH